MDDVEALLRDLRTREPGRPRLTWYGSGHERVELSGKVLDNWVAKTAGLLAEEFDAGPGTRVLLDLPPHWRTVTWTLATWLTGACVVLADGTVGIDVLTVGTDVLVTADPAAAAAAAARYPDVPCAVVALPALAMSFDGDLPLGAIDAAIEVRLQDDVFAAYVRIDPTAEALDIVGPGREQALTITHADLLTRARALAPDTGARVLLDAGANTTSGTGTGSTGVTATGAARDPLTTWLPPLCVNGSVVIVHHLASLTDDARAALVDAERITGWSPPS